MTRTFIITLIVLAGCSQPKSESAVSGLPTFQLTMLNGKKVMSNQLSGKTILIFYNPDCDHCQREAEEIHLRLDEFKAYTLYFIAASPDENVMQFATKYDLLGKDNVLFASAEVQEVVREMGPMDTPCLLIYSEERQLIKKFDGETPVEDIIKFL